MGNLMLLLWIMIAIWLGCATLLPLYVFFKALFRSDLRRRTRAARILLIIGEAVFAWLSADRFAPGNVWAI